MRGVSAIRLELRFSSKLIFKEYNKNMSKKYITIILVLLILVLVGGGYYWKITNMKKSATDVVNPVNPTESVPGANPYDKTNPFSNIKVNPFE